MPNDNAWLIVRKDISTDTDYTVFLNEHVANEAAAKSIEYIAQNELDTIGFDKEHKDMLRDILKDIKKGNWKDAIAGWEGWRDEMGPLDDDVEMIMIDLVT